MPGTGNQRSVAFLVACTGIATYASMDVVMKGLSLELGAYNALFWRSIFSVLFAGALYLWRRKTWPKREAMKLHVWRGAVVSIMAFLFFWGIKYLPVAEAIGLSFIAPLIALYLAAILLHEKISSMAMVASVLGLLGAVIVIGGKLSGDYDDNIGPGIAAILVSAILYAYNIILQRQQALVADPFEIAFYQNCTIIVLFSALAPFLAEAPAWTAAPNLALAAFLGVISLMMMSWAYARAPANFLIPVEYTAFAWAALLGWLAFGDVLTFTTTLGTALIVGGCLINARQDPEQVDHIESTAA